MVEVTEERSLGWSGLSHWTEETSPKVLVGPDGWKPTVEPEVYTCQFKGNTLVDISPRSEGPGCPLYLREHFKSSAAPMRKVDRYVSSRTPTW